MTVDEVRRAALALDLSSRASLARDLLNSLESLSDSEVERLWVEEAMRRDAELDAGTAGSISAEDALAQARARRR